MDFLFFLLEFFTGVHDPLRFEAGSSERENDSDDEEDDREMFLCIAG